MQTYRLLGCAAVPAIMLAGATPALAQNEETAAAPSTATLNEIIVTANKREQAINDVGLSITVQSGEDMTIKGIDSPTDLGKIVPGLTVQPSPFNTPVYTLRGIGFYETTLSAAPTVAVYTDEIALPFSATTRGVAFDVQRVEVLKGPQGTLFGQNTTGGAINYIVNKPTDTFDAGVDLSYGRFNTIDVQGFVSGPITNGVNARLSARTIQSDDWQYSYTRDDTLGAQDKIQGRFQLEIDPGNGFRVMLNANGWQDKSDTQAAQLIEDSCGTNTASTCGSPDADNFRAYPPAPNNARAADWSYGIFSDYSLYDETEDFSTRDYSTRGENNRPLQRDDRFYQLSARVDLDLTAALTLTSITAYSDYKTNSVQDFDGSIYATVDTNTSGYIKNFSQELRVSGNYAWGNFIIGANYDSSKTYDRLFYNFSQGPSSDPLYAVPDSPRGQLTFNYSDQDVKNYAVFGNIEYALTDSLDLVAGARYTESKRDFEGCTNDFGGGTAIWWNSIFGTDVQPGECLTFTADFPEQFRPALFDELNEDNISWNVGLNYKTASNALLYARVSRGYKSGSFPTASVASFSGYTPVKQESVTAYELGFKAPFANGLVNISAAAFYYDYKNKQLRGRKPDPVFVTLDALVQIPKSSVTGVEAQIDLRPADGLTMSFGGTYIDTKIKEYTGFDALGVERNFTGQDFPYAPALTAIGDINYDFALGSNAEGYMGASVTYNSDTTSALSNTTTEFVDEDKRYAMKAYALLDLRAGVRLNDDKIRIGGYVRNVTNTFYWTNVQDNLASISRFTGMPRTYGVQLSWRY
ncbi:TonB-dependent receptor [Croceicoccus bisphenolivorans]|uniref:TonB-dependent receptor n=1 Tax=Croceicoccus bisphenolivorans TaxID=1783232 RepID=UPI0008323AFF|nr:TonB-dependent receptor [Croceicoccus bisphenolivorans]